jgi:hypothetical protein
LIIKGLSYITFLFEIIPFFLCVYNYKRLKTKDLKVFFIYTTLLFLLLLPVFYYRFINVSDTIRLFFLRIFLVVEFTLVSFVFYYNIGNRFLRQMIRILPILFLIYSVYDYYSSPANKFNYQPLVTECLLLMIYIIYFFYEKIQTSTSVPIYLTKIFWIAVAFIIYSAGNFFLFLYSNNPVKDKEFLTQYTLIYSTFAILKNISLSIGILVNQPEPNNDNNPDFITQNSFSDSSLIS